MPESRGGRRNPILSLIGLVVLVAVIGVGLKVYLNPADRRAQELCYPVYATFSFFRVTIMRPMFPQEHAFILRGIEQGRTVYFTCVSTAHQFPGFERSRE